MSQNVERLRMSVGHLLRKKRDGEELTKDEIEYLIQSMVSGKMADSQIGALLMAMYIRGLSETETVHLTCSMISSGEQRQWPEEWLGQLVDKHSTGGVGDKISLILAPVLAACGLKVPMVSGRGLEHTGGTVDKLESIPGFSVYLDEEQMGKALEDAGCFIAAASSHLCPADKILYSTRDITSTVDCINLIVPSIISKKVASGTKFLVMDVKVGKAAFCKTVETARALARQLIRVSGELGVQTRVVLSRMDEPLGTAVGNALEVAEAICCLAEHMPADIYQLVSVLGTNLLEMTGYKGNCEEQIRKVTEDGSALEMFRRMLLVQGVKQETVRTLLSKSGESVLPTTKFRTQLRAPSSGWVAGVDAWRVGQVCLELGAGRQTGRDAVDPSVGAVVHKHIGDAIVQGEAWLTLHHSALTLPQGTEEYLQQALAVVNTPVDKPNIIIEVIQ